MMEVCVGIEEHMEDEAMWIFVFRGCGGGICRSEMICARVRGRGTYGGVKRMCVYV